MTEQLKKDLSDFELQRISGGELRSRLPFPMENKCLRSTRQKQK